MNLSKEEKSIEEIDFSETVISSKGGNLILLPLSMCWEPKEDITAYELALCMPYLTCPSRIMPYEIDVTDSYLRHFVITDTNKEV